MVGILQASRKANLDTTILRTFVAISEHGGFSEAAHALHLTQSAVSHHIRRLEEQVEKSLFCAHGRRRRLTEDGEVFLWYARQILALNDEAFEKLGRKSGPVAEIRLGVSEYFAQDYLPIVLSSLRFDHDEVRILPQLGRSTVLQKKLVDGELDAVIAVGALEIPVMSEQDFPVAHRGLSWFGSSDALPSPCEEVPLVVFSSPCILRDLQINELKKSKKLYRVVYEAQDLGELLAAVKAGLGVSALPCTPSLYGLTPPTGVEHLPILPNVRVYIKTGASVKLSQLEWLIQLIRRCWSLPEQRIDEEPSRVELHSE